MYRRNSPFARLNETTFVAGHRFISCRLILKMVLHLQFCPPTYSSFCRNLATLFISFHERCPGSYLSYSIVKGVYSLSLSTVNGVSTLEEHHFNYMVKYQLYVPYFISDVSYQDSSEERFLYFALYNK